LATEKRYSKVFFRILVADLLTIAALAHYVKDFTVPIVPLQFITTMEYVRSSMKGSTISSYD
jgi:hypothetical protein